LEEQFNSQQSSTVQRAAPPSFSGEACDLLATTVRSYLGGGSVLEELGQVTAQLCREAHSRGLSADETLAEIRSTLGGILANCPITSSDRAALIALAIDECVHAFYHQHR